MRALTRVVAPVLLACVVLAAPSAASVAKKPGITDLRAHPTTVPAAGGAITFTARVSAAEACDLSGPGSQFHVRVCTSGSFRVRLVVPPNTSSTGRVISVTLSAYGSGTTSRHTAFFQEGAQQPASGTTTTPTTTTPTPEAQPPPVVDLDACVAGPDCFYGPIYNTYDNYGNVAPADLGDCTFAAAADWEQILLGVAPDPTVIGYEFSQAGGTAAGGLPQNSLWTYWMDDGIGGEYLTGLHRYFTDQTDVENGVRDYGAMIVEFEFVANDGFAQYTMTAGFHDAVVDGFTPEGPLVVSWGQTLQMSWAQWSAEVVGMWGIAAGPTAMPF